MIDTLSGLIEAESHLTYGEYVLLLASIQSRLYPEKFNCYRCITQYGESKKMMAKTERKRQSKGCFELGVKSYKLENILYNQCIGNYVVNIDFFMDAYFNYEKGVLPFGGTLDVQPNKMIMIMNIISGMKSDYLKKESK